MAEAIESFKSSFSPAELIVTTGSSGLLCKQIENGAPADIIVSAERSFLDKLSAKNLIEASSMTVIATNRLVLIAPKDSPLTSSSNGLTILKDRQIKRIAIGNPEHVPAGIYAMEALRHAGIDQRLKEKLVFADDVRMATRYAAEGAVDAAIVYQSDTIAFRRDIKVICDIPAGSYSPIEYVSAICSATKQQDTAKKFLQFIAEPDQRAKLKELGFELSLGPTHKP